MGRAGEGTCQDPRLAVFEPAHLLGRELDVEAVEAVVELVERARSNERDRGEWLREHVGERHMDWLLAELARELDGPIAPRKVLVVVPDAHHLLAVALVAAGAVGEEAACLARPREVSDLPRREPLPPRRGRRGDAASPDRLEHLGECKVV